MSWRIDHRRKVPLETEKAGSTPGLDIDVCTLADFDGIFLLLQQLWPNKTLDREPLRALFKEAVAADSRVLLRAEIDQYLAGFGSMTIKPHLWHAGLIAWVDELVVDQKYRGRGVGRALLNRLTDAARERGCRAMELDSAFHRTEAHSFYEKLGFEKRAFLFSRRIDR